MTQDRLRITSRLDAQGLRCPMPLLMTKRALHGMAPGEQLQVLATDRGALRDIPLFAEMAGHKMLVVEEGGGVIQFVLQKGHS